MNQMQNIPHAKQQGSTLLEALISMLVLGIGLLGMANLQGTSQQAELDSYQRSQALILAKDMVSRVSANRQARDCYDTDSLAGDSFLGQGGAVTPCVDFGITETRDRANADNQEWHALLKGEMERLAINGSMNSVGAMTGARGCVQLDAPNDTVIVTVAWQGQNPTSAPAGNTCAQGQFGEESLRRIVELRLRLGNLN